MQNLRNWFLSLLLKKDNLVAVPISWQREYAQLCGYKIQVEEDMGVLVQAYNDLLKDFYAHLTIAELKQEIKESEIQIKSTASKEEMAAALYEKFEMKRVVA
jgi:hypothetical protein